MTQCWGCLSAGVQVKSIKFGLHGQKPGDPERVDLCEFCEVVFVSREDGEVYPRERGDMYALMARLANRILGVLHEGREQ